MSVLIYGLNEPKCCRDCRFFVFEGAGAVSCKALKEIIWWDDDRAFKPWKQKSKRCPMVQVPDALVEIAVFGEVPDREEDEE